MSHYDLDKNLINECIYCIPVTKLKSGDSIYAYSSGGGFFGSCLDHEAQYKVKEDKSFLYLGPYEGKKLKMKNSSVSEKSKIDTLTGCQIHSCDNEADSIFATHSGPDCHFYFSYCQRHAASEIRYPGGFAFIKKVGKVIDSEHTFFNYKPIDFKIPDTYIGDLSLKAILGSPTSKLTPKVKVNEGDEGKFDLYHVIYRSGAQTYHFSTFARSGPEAKEKIIQAEKYNHDSDFEKAIRGSDIHLVKKGVLMVYEKP